MKWHKITEKLPLINKGVFILDNKKINVRYAWLKIYEETKTTLEGEHNFKDGDIYWTCYIEFQQSYWGTTKRYPYWLTGKELAQLTTKKTKKTKETDRFEILDL